MSPVAALDVAAAVPRGTGAVGVGVFAGARGLRLAGRGAGHPRVDLAYLEARGFTAAPGEAQALPAAGGKAVVAVGLGEPSKLDAEALRKGGAVLVRTAKTSRVAMMMAGAVPAPPGATAAAQAFCEGAALASYAFRVYKSGSESAGAKGTKKNNNRVEMLTLIGTPARALTEGVRRATVLTEAVAFARDLVNEPAGSLPPARFAERAVEQLAGAGVEIDVWEEERITAERLGGVLGVCAGSVQPPRFLVLSYRGGAGRGSAGRGSAGGTSRARHVALVGKGVTFDSGGLSLKTAAGMETMKTDMSGAAAVVAAMSALEGLGVTVPVAGYVPLVENMPSGSATRPGDVLRARNGKTIEVLNTDAEGRLILADALSLAAEAKPAATVDLATLTGACSIALGDRIAGLMGNDDRVLAAVEAASQRAGEPVWRLPLPDMYRKHIDSEVADIKNIGVAGGAAGALTAGLFLAEFAGAGPWAHLDIAGPARSGVDEGYLRKGGTGFGVRMLVELLSGWRR